MTALRLVLSLLASLSLLTSDIRLQANDAKQAVEAPEPTRTAAADIYSHPLIVQLGSEEFTRRREAEAKLRAMGGEAFDMLEQARQHPDLEVSTQAEYILQLINQDSWVRESDPEAVRSLMGKYGRGNLQVRREIIDDLVRLEDRQGLSALARIAHYELTPYLAKHSALRVMEQRKKHVAHAREIRDLLVTEIGESSRDPAEWLRLYASQLEMPSTVLPQWLPLLDAELDESRRAPDDRLAIPGRLLQFHTSLSEDLDDPSQQFESLKRRVDYALEETGEPRRAIYPSQHDLVEKENWDVLKLFEEHYQKEIAGDRLLLYQSAIASDREGDKEKAAKIAAQAYRLTRSEQGNDSPTDLQERNSIADALAEWGHHDWAEREWNYVTEHAELSSSESMNARISLANWCLHDRGEDKEAAAILAEVCDAVDANEELKNALLRDNDARNLLVDVRRGREYFTACYLEQQKDFEGQKKHLELAYTHQNWLQDPDILIAMYRLQGADESYRRKVQGRIRRAAKQVEEYIERVEESLAERGLNATGSPQDAIFYNHWAWLVSNTEGDYEQAIEYSKRSLEFSPGSASYLDTLGRCYYAAGDLENAVKYQRQAVEKQPMVRVMQRQLKLFESELAQQRAQQAGESS